MRNPVLRAAAALTGVALAWGGVQAAQNLWASRRDDAPISSSSRAQSGALRVSGHGMTLTFPHGWINVPTTPNELARFLRSSSAEFPHLRAALKNQLENMQNVRNIAMLAYRINASGAVTGSLNVVVIPASPPPSQLLPHLDGVAAQFGGTHQHDSLTTFGTYAAALVTWTLPGRAGARAEYGAQAYLHGPSSTPIITVRTFNAADTITLLRQIAGTIKFS
jgi:hypothetical protein